MTIYREEATFTVRLALTAEFNEQYDGDADGYQWLTHWQSDVKPRLVRAVYDVLRSDPQFEVIPAPRGAAPEETVEIAIRYKSP